MGLRKMCRWVLTFIASMLAACAIITVNVYFPEKDVKEAYKSVDEMLLKQDRPDAAGEGKQPAEGEKKEKDQSRSWFFDRDVSFALIGTAHAEEPVADQLAVELSSMPEVLKAYDDMRQRLPQLNQLRDAGVVGETKQGLIAIRDKTKFGAKQPIIDAENKNRKTVITGMAKAILKLNKKPVIDANINQVLGKAAASYATIRQEEAKPGWWIELQNGKWVQK